MRIRSGRGAVRGRVDGADRASSVRHTARGTVGGRWLLRGKDGRLTAYARSDEGLLRWTELSPGGPEWTGPDLFPVADLSHLTVTQGEDFYVHFLGRREVRRPEGPPAVDIVHAIQYQTGRPVTEWRSLGNPHRNQQEAAELGPPVGAIAPDGTVHVFARSAQGGLVLRREAPNGKWRVWENLRGVGVAGLPAPVALKGGRIEVCTAAETGVLFWRQLEAAGDFTGPRGFSLSPLPGTVAGLETGPERLTFYWTDAAAAGGGAAAWRAGSWPVALGGSVAEGPYATLRTSLDGYDCVVLAHRGAEGSAMLGVGPAENEVNGFWWYDLAEGCEGVPALALDGRGRVVMALIGPDGMPKVARQEAGAGLTLTRWQQL